MQHAMRRFMLSGMPLMTVAAGLLNASGVPSQMPAAAHHQDPGAALQVRRLTGQTGVLEVAPNRQVVANNLGGMGPNTADPQMIRYSPYFILDGRQVDMIVTNRTTYPGVNTGQNGFNGDLGRINVEPPNRFVDLAFKFVYTDDGSAVTMPDFYFTFNDLDGDTPDLGAEKVQVALNHMQSYNLSDGTEVATGQADGMQYFQSTQFGQGCDDPSNSQDLTVVDCDYGQIDQLKRTATVLMKGGQEEYWVTYAVGGATTSQRSLFFDGTPAPLTPAPTPAPTPEPAEPAVTPAPTPEPLESDPCLDECTLNGTADTCKNQMDKMCSGGTGSMPPPTCDSCQRIVVAKCPQCAECDPCQTVQAIRRWEGHAPMRTTAMGAMRQPSAWPAAPLGILAVVAFTSAVVCIVRQVRSRPRLWSPLEPEMEQFVSPATEAAAAANSPGA